MYDLRPSFHAEIVRQRHEELMANAERHRLIAEARAQSEDSKERLLAVKSVFAGIVAAVSGVGKAKPQPAHKPGFNPV